MRRQHGSGEKLVEGGLWIRNSETNASGSNDASIAFVSGAALPTASFR